MLLHQWSRQAPIPLSALRADGPIEYYGGGGSCRAALLAGMTRLRPGFGDVGHMSLVSPVMAVDVAVHGGLIAVASPTEARPNVTSPPRVEGRGCQDWRHPVTRLAALGVVAVAAGRSSLVTWAPEPARVQFGEWRDDQLVLSGASVLDDAAARLAYSPTSSGLTWARATAKGETTATFGT